MQGFHLKFNLGFKSLFQGLLKQKIEWTDNVTAE